MNPPAPKKTRRIPLTNVALLLIATSLVGQVLGFLRTKLVNGNFSIHGPHSTDAYFAAFNIPDFFFYTLAAGALGVAFIPVLTDRLHKGDRKGMWELSDSLLNLLAIIMAVVGVIIFIFAKPLIHHIVAPGLDTEQLNTATTIMRFLAFDPLLFTISGILSSTQQTLGRFFFYAIAPVFYNVSIIASIYLFKNNIGIVGLGLGALLGAVLQLVVVSLGLFKTGFHWRPRILWHSRDFHTVLRQLPPRSLDQGMDQLESIVETRFASHLGTGVITNYNNAYILMTAPVLLIGTAISTAAFPRLSTRLSQGRPDLFRRDFLRILRVMIWIAAPVVVVAFFARGYLARLIYTQGNDQIAQLLGYLTMAIFFRIIYTSISRWFYAQKDTKTPLIVSVFTIALNISLVATLARSPNGYGAVGLALAQSIVAAVEVFILSAIMLYRDRGLFNMVFWGGVGRIISVSGFSMIAGYIVASLFPFNLSDRGFVTLGAKFLLITAVVFAVHIAVSALFGLEEVMPFLRRLKRIVLKPIRIDV